MSEWKTIGVYEQAGTFDGRYSLPIDPYLLMKIINHSACEDAEDLAEMTNPKRLAVKMIIEVKELPMPTERAERNK